MRLGLLVYGSLETVSGGYLYDRMLVDYLQRQGDEVEIVSLPWRNYALHLSDNLSPELFQRLRSLEVEVLLQDELNHPSLFWLNRRLAGKVSYACVAIVHHLRSSERHPAWQKIIYRAVERDYLCTLDGFIFNSQTTHRAVENMGIDLSWRPWVIAYPSGDFFPSDVDEDWVRQRASQAGPLRLVFVGNVIERKGLHTLLEALGGLPRSCCTLEVIGSLKVEPAYSCDVQRQAAAQGLNDMVRFHGALDHAGMAGLLRQAHVMAVPSSYEGFGIVYAEGMGFGLPAIAGADGAAWEVVTSGENGFLIPPGDAAGLARNLQLLAADRQLLAQMGLAALRRFHALPTWEDMGRTAREFLLSMAEAR